jgi:hypothetical protein
MTGKDYRGSSRCQIGQDTVHLAGSCGVKTVGRFVEHQQPRPGQECSGEPEALSHPKREAANAVVCEIG